jgi:hypothetical protein
MMGHPSTQRGAALVTGLVLLVIITLLTITAMRASTLELRMASNEQERTAAFDSAQSAVEAVLTDPTNFQVTGTVGSTICTENVGCERKIIVLPSGDPFTDDHAVIVTRLAPDMAPPPRNLETSADKFAAAFFSVDGEFDASAAGGGNANVVQGYLVMVPKSGQSN